MNAPMNWGLIRTGATFESLMQCLVIAEDPGAELFGRAGKDLAMDALSSDGRCVYQAKFGIAMTMDDLIVRSKKEVEKILKLRERDDKNWRDVNRWVMVANVSQNVWDVARWNENIAMPLSRKGIAVEKWTVEDLGVKLINHPEIRLSFFGPANRCMLYLREAEEKLRAESLGEMFFDMSLQGRAAQLEQFEAFIQDEKKRIFLVHAPHGFGRSRFLYEAMERCATKGVRTFWGLPETMDVSTEWFASLERPERTVLFVDDCANKFQRMNCAIGNWLSLCLMKAGKWLDRSSESFRPWRRQSFQNCQRVR